MSFLCRVALPLLLFCTGPAVYGADLETMAAKPYQLKVILDVARHRQLTRDFVEQFERDLRDTLQTELGDLAEVEVVRADPLLKIVRAKGLEVLDSYSRITGVKVHFVRLSLSGGRYELQARQYDGTAGLASHGVRKDRTSDRLLVARTAALLVIHDFGLAGTVTKVNDQTVEVTLQGGQLGVDLKRWVGRDEVFAVTQITRTSGGLRSTVMPWVFLQVIRGPHDGVISCRLFHRFKNDTLAGQSGVLGYRCLKLRTVRSTLRMRFLDFKTHEPLRSLRVHITTPAPEGVTKQVTTDQDGLMPRTEESYAHVAIVKVLTGTKVRAQIPVAMVGDQTVDCLLRVSAEDEEEGQKELRRDHWVRRLYDSLRVAADRVTELNELGKKSKRQEALEKATQGLASLKSDLKSLREEKDQLAKVGGLDLSEGTQLLEELEKRRQELDGFVTRIGKFIKDEKDPRKRDMLSNIEQAHLLETEADFDQAIELYEKTLAENPKQTKVRERLVRLKKAWARQNADHGKARAYIYTVWPALTEPAKVQAGLKELRWAFDVCKKAGDSLSPQKILRANVKHADNLRKRQNALRPETREDDRKEAKIIEAVAKDLKEVHEQVAEYLKKEKPAFP
jgi:hypothetical protein